MVTVVSAGSRRPKMQFEAAKSIIETYAITGEKRNICKKRESKTCVSVRGEGSRWRYINNRIFCLSL